jgi:hypothetical protein
MQSAAISAHHGGSPIELEVGDGRRELGQLSRLVDRLELVDGITGELKLLLVCREVDRGGSLDVFARARLQVTKTITIKERMKQKYVIISTTCRDLIGLSTKKVDGALHISALHLRQDPLPVRKNSYIHFNSEGMRTAGGNEASKSFARGI